MTCNHSVRLLEALKHKTAVVPTLVVGTLLEETQLTTEQVNSVIIDGHKGCKGNKRHSHRDSADRILSRGLAGEGRCELSLLIT